MISNKLEDNDLDDLIREYKMEESIEDAELLGI